jgi:hypothetical protein
MISQMVRVSYAAVQEQFERAFIGMRCISIEKLQPVGWSFRFEGGTGIYISCPWRIVANGRIYLGHVDHEQQFGLPAPLDGQQKALEYLSSKVVRVTIREITADLTIDFENGSSLEVFNNSGGYEGWNCLNAEGLQIIGMGGGGLTTVSRS